MKHLHLFEAFSSKSISSIDSFLKKVGTEHCAGFLAMLINISERTDIPLSNFKGDYMSAKKAIGINSKTDDIIKLWFTLDDGYITFTMNNKDEVYNIEDLKDEDVEFVKNNLITDRYLKTIPWRYSTYNGIYQDIKLAQYALVINLSKLDKGLSGLKRDRKANKPLPRIDNEFYRRENRKRWNEKMPKRYDDDDDLYNMLGYLQKSHRNHRLIDMILDAYNRGDISKASLRETIKSLFYDGMSEYMWKIKRNRWDY